jgi:hypothetical protein
MRMYFEYIFCLLLVPTYADNQVLSQHAKRILKLKVENNNRNHPHDAHVVVNGFILWYVDKGCTCQKTVEQ